MENGRVIDIGQVEHLMNVIIPKMRKKLTNPVTSNKVKADTYNMYVETLRICAPLDFSAYNMYLELDDNHNMPNKAFYYHRKEHLKEIVDAMNDMEVHDKYDMMLISLPPRVGKEQPLYSKILTPTGWSTMGQMNVGSKIIGSDGKSHNVTGVFPQGMKDVYTVIFDDDTTVECGLEHLWTVQTRDDRRSKKSRTVTTAEMMKNLYVEGGTRKNYSVQYVKPVEFESQLSESDLHPYLLGALIGDGCFTLSATELTNIDEELLDRIRELVPSYDALNIKDGITYSIQKKDKTIRTELGYSVPSHTLSKIREYGLDYAKSNAKFIPKKYLYADYNSRVELLRGLMDTDGYAGDVDNTYCEYTTVSKQLSEDVIELVRSLGGRVTVSTKIGSYKKDGVKINCQLVYRIVFNISDVNPFHISRKADIFSPRATRPVKYIKSIEKTGKSECQCIMVDAPDHLYVTDGFNVTHNTTFGIRFLSWIIGKYPEATQLATSYSDAITQSFYTGVMEIVASQRFLQIFPESPIVNQNAKREEIWLKVMKRYPSITFVPINGSMTGRCEASKYLYCDDLVSGIEEALSVTRLEKLWGTYTINAKQRKLQGCKEIHIATRWSVHDPISKLSVDNEDNPRCKIISLPCYDENRESKFDFVGGFNTAYYNELERTMDTLTFNALYMQEPIEREGLLYHREDLQYYMQLPSDKPDTVIAVCDSKGLGVDYVASPIGYVYGDYVYVTDVVFNNGLPEITRPLVANKWFDNKVVRGDVEMNNGGDFYAEGVNELIGEKGGRTSMRTFFTSTNKKTKIITYSDYIKKYFIFRSPSTYSPNSEYAEFMKNVFSYTQMGKVKHDDAPDSLSMLAELMQGLSGNVVKVIDRRQVGL